MNPVLLAFHLSCGLAADAAACAPTATESAAVARARLTAQAAPPRDEWFASDKIQHFTLSWGVTAFAFAGVQIAGAEGDTRMRIAAGVAFLAGMAKELADSRRGYGFSVRDLVYDVLGIATAWAVLSHAR